MRLSSTGAERILHEFISAFEFLASQLVYHPPVVVRIQAADQLGGAAELRLGDRATPAGFGFTFAAT
jgi:hypothetical protein